MCEWRLRCPLMQLLMTPVRLLTVDKRRVPHWFLLMLMLTGIASTLSSHALRCTTVTTYSSPVPLPNPSFSHTRYDLRCVYLCCSRILHRSKLKPRLQHSNSQAQLHFQTHVASFLGTLPISSPTQLYGITSSPWSSSRTPERPHT